MPFVRFRSTAALVLTALVSAWATSYGVQDKPKQVPAKQPALTNRLVLLSINGLSSDHILRPQRYRHRIANLVALRDRGSYAAGVESVYPSQTLPSHATIATGMLPVDHGVFADLRFDLESGVVAQFSEAKQIGVDTIWEATRRASLKSASRDFPLTTGAVIDFEVAAGAGIDSLIDLLEKNRVNLLMVNFRSFAMAQVRYGVDSKEAVAAIESIDTEIGKLSGFATANETTFMVVSDAARAPVEREFRPNVVLAKKELLATDSKGNVTSWRAICQASGGSAAVFVRNPQDEKLVAEVEQAFREIHEKPESPIWRVTVRREAARLGADPRPVLFLDAAPLHTMSSKATGGTTGGADVRATSGYLPQRSEMRAALVIAGRGIKPGIRLEFARLVDIAPTISRLLGLELRTSRGRVLNEVLIQ